MHRSESFYCFAGPLDEELPSCLLLPVPARYILDAELKRTVLHWYFSAGDPQRWVQCRLGTSPGMHTFVMLCFRVLLPQERRARRHSVVWLPLSPTGFTGLGNRAVSVPPQLVNARYWIAALPLYPSFRAVGVNLFSDAPSSGATPLVYFFPSTALALLFQCYLTPTFLMLERGVHCLT